MQFKMLIMQFKLFIMLF